MNNNINSKIIKYKPAKTTKEMVDKLFNYKRVRYNSINKEEAEEILLRYNYINVITPFKHHFAKQNKKGKLIKDNGNHIYERDVEFSEYYNLYKNERKNYPKIYSNISKFENHFKSITAYYIFHNYNKIETPNDIKIFLENIKTSISLQNNKYSDRRISMMLSGLDNISNDDYIYKFCSVYVFFDRLSLGMLLTIYIGLNPNTQEKIYKEMVKFNQHLDASNVDQFISRTYKLVGIRNYVMHNNSLEILIRFYDTKSKESLRKRREREAYNSLIEYLSKEK